MIKYLNVKLTERVRLGERFLGGRVPSDVPDGEEVPRDCEVRFITYNCTHLLLSQNNIKKCLCV